MLRLIFASVLLCVPTISFAKQSKASVIRAEYGRLYKYVKDLKPEGQVGGVLNSKKVGQYEFLWKLEQPGQDYAVIRVYNEHKDGKDFAISYYRARYIDKDHNMIRRIVGSAVGGNQRIDSIDVDTLEDLGLMGTDQPMLDKTDRELLNLLGTELFD